MDNKINTDITVSYIVYEGGMARMERINFSQLRLLCQTRCGFITTANMKTLVSRKKSSKTPKAATTVL